MSDISVGYKTTHKPTLTYILWREWDEMCAWGKHKIKLHETEIDHIVPKSIPDSHADPNRMRLHEWKLPIDLDVHDPRNLAPICRLHNEEKAEEYYWESALAIGISKKAQQKRGDIIREATVSTKAHIVGRALARAWNAAESLPEDHDVIQSLGSGIMRRLTQLKVDYTQISDLLIESPHTWQELRIRVEGDDETRFTMKVSDRVCGLNEDWLLQTVAISVQEKLYVSLQDAARTQASNHHEQPTLDPGFFDLRGDSYVVTKATLTSNFDGSIDFVFKGYTSGEANSMGVWDDEERTSTTDIQITAHYRQSFEVFLVCDLTDLEMLRVEDVVIGRDHIDDSIDIDFE